MLDSSAYINLRGTQHYYQWIRHGNPKLVKPVMVFVHGWGGSARYWESTAEALAADFDCLLYDLRGFGRSRELSPTLAYEMEDYADDLAALLDTFELDQVYLNGHSMGASVTAIVLNRYPERVKKAILTCSGIFDYNKLTFNAFHKAGTYVVKFRYPWFLKVPFADQLFMARFLHRPIPKEERQAFLADFLQATYDAATGTIYTSVSKKASEMMPEEFRNIPVPTLLVAGEKDIIIPAAMGRRAASLNEKVEYCEIPNTAHFPMLEDAPTYLKQVQEFLFRHSSSPSG